MLVDENSNGKLAIVGLARAFSRLVFCSQLTTKGAKEKDCWRSALLLLFSRAV